MQNELLASPGMEEITSDERSLSRDSIGNGNNKLDATNPSPESGTIVNNKTKLSISIGAIDSNVIQSPTVENGIHPSTGVVTGNVIPRTVESNVVKTNDNITTSTATPPDSVESSTEKRNPNVERGSVKVPTEATTNNVTSVAIPENSAKDQISSMKYPTEKPVGILKHSTETPQVGVENKTEKPAGNVEDSTEKLADIVESIAEIPPVSVENNTGKAVTRVEDVTGNVGTSVIIKSASNNGDHTLEYMEEGNIEPPPSIEDVSSEKRSSMEYDSVVKRSSMDVNAEKPPSVTNGNLRPQNEQRDVNNFAVYSNPVPDPHMKGSIDSKPAMAVSSDHSKNVFAVSTEGSEKDILFNGISNDAVIQCDSDRDVCITTGQTKLIDNNNKDLVVLTQGCESDQIVRAANSSTTIFPETLAPNKVIDTTLAPLEIHIDDTTAKNELERGISLSNEGSYNEIVPTNSIIDTTLAPLEIHIDDTTAKNIFEANTSILQIIDEDKNSDTLENILNPMSVDYTVSIPPLVDIQTGTIVPPIVALDVERMLTAGVNSQSLQSILSEVEIPIEGVLRPITGIYGSNNLDGIYTHTAYSEGDPCKYGTAQERDVYNPSPAVNSHAHLMSKLIACLLYLTVNVGLEFVSQYLYKQGYNFPIELPLLQWVFLGLIGYPVLTIFGYFMGAPYDMFQIPTDPWKYFEIYKTGLLFGINITTGRLLAYYSGPAMLAVNTAMVLPATCIMNYLWTREHIGGMELAGVVLSSATFIINIVTGGSEEYPHVIWIGIINASISGIYNVLIKHVNETHPNKVEIVWIHMPWNIISLFLATVYVRPYVGLGDCAITTAKGPIPCNSVFDCAFKDDNPFNWFMVATIIVGGVPMQLSTVYIYTKVAAVTVTVLSQVKSVVVTGLGVAIDLIFHNAVRNTWVSYVCAGVRLVGNALYTAGRFTKNRNNTSAPVAESIGASDPGDLVAYMDLSTSLDGSKYDEEMNIENCESMTGLRRRPVHRNQ